MFEAAAKPGEAAARLIYGGLSNGRLVSWNAVIPAFAPVPYPCHRFAMLGKAPNGAVTPPGKWI